MTMSTFGAPRLKRLLWVVILICMTASPGWAKSTGTDIDNALESGPCFKALVDRNAEHPTTAPDRELGSACDVENGNVDKAWERVQRLWGESSGMPDYGDFAPPEAQGPSPWSKAVAVLSMLLVYVVLGTPMRAASRLMGVDCEPRRFAAARLLGSLLVRLVIALLLRLLLQIPYATLLGSVLVVGLVLRGRRTTSRPAIPMEVGAETTPPSALSLYAADIINDGSGSTSGLLAMTVLAQRDPALVFVVLILAIAASIPRILIERRRLRANPGIFTILSALLAAIMGVFALSDPPIAAAVGSGRLVATVTFLMLGCAALALGRHHFRSFSRQIVG